MADYDNAEVTTREQKAADNLSSLAEWNAQSTKNQLDQQLKNYDLADQQNRALADKQLYQNSLKARNERYAQQKKLQTSAQALLGSMDNALRGSTLYSFNDMLRTRQDLDNNDSWTTLMQNQDAVENAYQESLNQNNLSRNDAISSAEYALRGIQSDTAAQLNNINPSLWKSPSEAVSGLDSSIYESQKNGQSVEGVTQSQSEYWKKPPLAHQFVSTQKGYIDRTKPEYSGYVGSLLSNYNRGR